MRSVDVLSNPNSSPLIVIVFSGETSRSSLSHMFFKIGVLKNLENFMRKQLEYLQKLLVDVFKAGVVKNFTIFTEKHLFQSLFYIKLQT